MFRLLFVEDDAELGNALAEIMGQKFFITHAADISTAKNLLTTSEFDLLLLDVSLPDGSGFDLYANFIENQQRKIPVIFLTGEADLTSRMKSLELGAQDYILKPFYTNELILRIEMRLQQFEKQLGLFTFCNLKFEINKQRVSLIENMKPDQDLNLTPNEYKILSLLVSNAGKPVSRSKIVDDVWGPGFSLSDKAVNSHISNLRKKTQNANCQIIATEVKSYLLKSME